MAYQLLTQEDKDHQGILEPNRGRKSGLSWKDIFVLVLFASTCTTTALVCKAVYNFVTAQPGSTPMVRPPPRVLRRVSPYTNPEGLRAVMKSFNATLQPIDNVAPSVFQMEANSRDRAIREDYSRHTSTEFGTIWPEDRRLVISPNTSTIYQFRNRDFEMEDCILRAEVPVQSPVFDPAVNIMNAEVNVWMLHEDAPELRPSISWGYAPARSRLFTTIRFNSTTSFTSQPFRCPGGQFSTFEFACRSAEPTCLVDFWQDLSIPPRGVYIVQRQSFK